MTVEEALRNLDQVCSEFKGTRQDHVALQQSMQTVTEALKPSEVPQKESEKKEPDGNSK